MYNLTQKQAREFLHTTINHLMVFKDDSEFGWTLHKKDDKQMFEIKTNKYGTRNSIKSYPCALGDGKIGQKDHSVFRPKKEGESTHTHTHTLVLLVYFVSYMNIRLLN
jgi:hypothetical protein